MDLSYGQPSLNPVWRSGKHKGKLPMASDWLVAKSHQCFFPFDLPIAKLHGMPRELIGQAGVIREPVGEMCRGWCWSVC